MAKKYISVAQAASKLDISTETIYNYLKKGILGGQYIKVNSKGTWKVDLDSLELLKESSTFKSSLQLKKENSEQYNLFFNF